MKFLLEELSAEALKKIQGTGFTDYPYDLVTAVERRPYLPGHSGPALLGKG